MRWVVLFAVVLWSETAVFGAEYKTKNFLVTAPTAEQARTLARKAEAYRKQLAKRWLGKVLPDWPKPVPVRFTCSLHGQCGSTASSYEDGKVEVQKICLTGTLAGVLQSTLPHEITHAILATHFEAPVPRWADEGCAIDAEPAAEKQRYAKLLRGRELIPLARLFAVNTYPRDVMAFYAQSLSVTRYLIGLQDRKTFIAFVKDGIDEGWDDAVKKHYGLDTIAKLEKRWLQSRKKQVAVKD